MKAPNHIRELRLQRGWSQQALAERVGTSQPQIDRLEKGERRLTVDWLIRVAKALGVEPESVMIVPPSARPSGSMLAMMPHGVPAGQQGAPRDLPIYGTVQGSRDARLVLEHEAPPIDWFYRPPELHGVPGAFAMYVVGDSMRPKYDAGDIVFINPNSTPKPGKAVVVQKTNNEAILKEYMGQTADGVRLRQYNPPLEFEVKQVEVAKLYRVLGAWDGR